MKNLKGFTIIELIVTIVIISVLVSIGFYSYTKTQAESRDSQRSARISAIAESLEEYFAKNGEYPGCTAMTQSGSTVAANTLVGIDQSALIAPKAAVGVTNSITCTALPASGPDAFAYVGDAGSACTSGGSCLQYTLQYREEATGTIKTLASRHQTQASTAATPTLTATTISDTQINLSWTTISTATGYQLQRATDTNFTANLVGSTPSGSSTSATGLAGGTTYYFRIAAITPVGQGEWSPVVNATTSLSPPTSTPTVSASLASPNVTGTATAVTCPSGTAYYQFQYRFTPTSTMGAWSSWSSWSTSTSYTVTNALQGHQYGFQAQARCTNGAVNSNTTATSNIATVVRPISTPAAPTYLSPSFFDSPNHAIVNFAGSCPTNTSVVNSSFRSRAWTGTNWGPNPWAFDDWWTNNTGSNKNVEYWGKYQCQTIYSTSAMSPESYNVIVVTP